MLGGTGAELYGVWGTSTFDVFAVGSDGTIVHYERLIGDVNGDEVLDIADYAELLTLILSSQGEYNSRADVNGDGSIDILDCTCLYAILLGY